MDTTIEDQQVGSLAVRLQRLMGAEPWQRTDAQVKEGLRIATTLITMAQAAAAQLVADAEDRNLPKLEGCTSTGVWLSHLTNISRMDAKRIIDPSRELTALVEETRRLWSAGSITTAQATIVCQAISTLPDWVDLPEKLMAQSILLENAKTFDNHDLQRLANHILEVIDPDGAEEHAGAKLEEEEKRALKKTSLVMQRTADGLTRVKAFLPHVQAGILRAALEGIASPRRNSPAIYDRDGDHSDAAVGTLTHDQKLGRAFCELLEHLPAEAMPQHGGLASTMTININLQALKDQIGRATLSTGDEMSAAQARRFACNANLIPLVLDGDSKILDAGTSKRVYDRYQRIALTKRDQGCVWKGCDLRNHRPGEARQPGSGEAAIERDEGARPGYHHLLHDGEWDARMSSDGIPEVIPPRRIDPQQKPIRHGRFKHGP